MNILYLCHRIPYPPNKGDKIRAFHQLRALREQHEVDVVTLADDDHDFGYRDALATYCRELTVFRLDPQMARVRSIPYLLSRTPLTLPYFYSAQLSKHVREALQKRSYDRIVVYSSAMAQYVECVQQIPIITDLVDVDSDKWMQYASLSRLPLSAIYRREGLALRRYERRVCEHSAAVVVSTDREARLIREISSAAAVHAISNGVDTRYFDPAAAPRMAGPPAVIFTGDMSYFPNASAVIYFAREVLPLIQASVPNTRFLIVGRNPGKAVLQLQAHEGIEVTGYVEDIRTHFARAQVAVAPFSIACGIQNKILEAMAYGLPIVATRRVLQGLTPQVAEMVATGDTSKELAASVVQLLRSPEKAKGRGVKSRQRVTAYYNWDRSMTLLLDLIRQPEAATVVRPSPNVGAF